MTLNCSVHLQTVAFDILATGIGRYAEQNTTRWVMTCLKFLEEVDAANPEGIALSLRWNSLEVVESYTVSNVQPCLSSAVRCKVSHTFSYGTQLERCNE